MLKTKTALTLSDKNYYSTEADWHYMSVSQYKNFNECEAATMARLKKVGYPVQIQKHCLLVIMFILTLNHQKFMIYSKRKTKTKCILVENHMGF